jgi:hypothetical protein
MHVTFWLTIQIGEKRIPLPLPLILFLALVIELLAFLPMTVYAIWKKKTFLLRLATGFYLSRLALILIFYSHGLKISVSENDEKIQIGGGWRR